MGSRVRLVGQEFALVGVAVAVAVSSLPFEPASAMAMAYQPTAPVVQPVADSSSHCYVSDTFNRTVATGWGTADTGQAWWGYGVDADGNAVPGQTVSGSVSGGVGYLNRQDEPYPDRTAEVTFPDPGAALDTVVRGQFSSSAGPDDWVRVWGGNYSSGSVHLFANGSYTAGGSDLEVLSPVSVDPTRLWYVRIHSEPGGSPVVGASYALKWWQADQPEPGAWQATWVDLYTLWPNKSPSIILASYRRPTLNAAQPPLDDQPTLDAGLGVWSEANLPFEVSYFSVGDSQCYQAQPTNKVTQVMFVHGIAASYGDQKEFSGLLTPVSNEAKTEGAVYRNFQYIQDKGDLQPDGTCEPRAVVQPSPGSSIYIDPTKENAAICDSNSDIGLNAVALWQDVYANYQATAGGKTILIANSMGGPIVRGMLDYAADQAAHGMPPVTALLDSVFFLEGVQSGSWIAAGNGVESRLGPFQSWLRDALTNNPIFPLPWKTNRPAGIELAPNSSWYNWANSTSNVPRNLPSFNAYGDINVQLQDCVLFLCGPEVGVGDGGDLVTLPGEPDQHSQDALGGARFLPYGSDGDHQEYELSDWVPIGVQSLTDLASVKAPVLTELQNSPVSHMSLPSTIGQVQVHHCGSASAATWSLAREYGNIIYRRLSGKSPSCDPNDWTDITKGPVQ